MPRACPACGSETVRETGEVAVRCPNRSCPAQLVESIKHFVSKGAMDIEGIGEETVVLLHEQRLIAQRRRPVRPQARALRALEDGEVVALPLFGAKTRKGDDGALEIVEAKRADKVLAAIEQSKERPFARVLFALGIRHVGSVTAQALVEQYPSMDALLAAEAEDLAEVPGIGPVVAEAVEQFLGDEHNRETIEKLRAAGRPPRGGAARRGGGPAHRVDVRAHRQAADAHARAGAGAHRGGRRQGEQFGEQGDRLRRRRRGPGIQARQGERPGRRRRSTRPACWSWRPARRKPEGQLSTDLMKISTSGAQNGREPHQTDFTDEQSIWLLCFISVNIRLTDSQHSGS